MTCDQALPAGNARCGNPVCNWSDREFEWNYAVAMRDGALKQAIHRYKYGGQTGWAMVFGRVLAGFLHEDQELFGAFDLIAPSPTYVGAGGRSFDHTAMVLAEAAALDTVGFTYALDPPPIIKTGPTTPLVDLRTWRERYEMCAHTLPDLLAVPDPSVVAGKDVLVYDDVFTDGLNLNAVAGALAQAGAARVCGVSLCRQPWLG